MDTSYKKKLIEVALPLEAINEGSKPETENPFLKGHPRAIHNWWARTPLSVCRAVLLAQLLDDPGEGLDTDQAEKAREPLLDLIRRLGTWEATADAKVIDEARRLIDAQFNGNPPAVWDMFAGRASISIEAQRLGLRVYSSDLNPISLTIQKSLLKYPQHFAGTPPVNRSSQQERNKGAHWQGRAAQGLMEDISAYGEWIRSQALRRIGHLYPRVVAPSGASTLVRAWLWARTVGCPNPVCRIQMPLVSSFALSMKAGKRTWIEPIVDNSVSPPRVRFEIKTGTGQVPESTKSGRGANFRCSCCGTIAPDMYVKAEGKAGRIGVQLMAIVAEGSRSRIYLPPTAEMEDISRAAMPTWIPDQEMPKNPRWFSPPDYGMATYAELFTPRQLVALTTFSDLVLEAREQAFVDAQASGLERKEGQQYADALATYLACALSRMTDYHCAFSTWNPTNENVRNLFQRQAIPMVWDFAEANPLEGKLDFSVAAKWVAESIKMVPMAREAEVFSYDARSLNAPIRESVAISTDPPYYDNIGYADLSDFFYIWMRRTLHNIDEQTFKTVLTPKSAELIASPYRHDGSLDAAEAHFRCGFASAFQNIRRVLNPALPMTVYYALKQAESESDHEGNDSTASTGWDTMLDGLVNAGFAITGTWPVRTTKKARSVARNTNALASAIAIVCRSRPCNAPVTTRAEFIKTLRSELPDKLKLLQHSSIAPVDLAQASIGPGMAVFTRYAKVLEADDCPMTVKTALQLINQALDNYLFEQEGEYDADTRFAITWFETYGMDAGPAGQANVLANARNVSVAGVAASGVLEVKGDKVWLLKREDMPEDWDPVTDARVTVWEGTQHLIRRLNSEGERAAAELLVRLGSRGEAARDLAYRLYGICERKKWADEARAYNGLVVAWPELTRLAAQIPSGPAQAELAV